MNDAEVRTMESTHSELKKLKLKRQTLTERILNFNTKENIIKIQKTAKNMYFEMLVKKYMSLYVKKIMGIIKKKLRAHFKYNVTCTIKALSSTTNGITFDCLHDRLSEFSVKTEQQPTPRDEDACGLQETTDDTNGLQSTCTQKENISSEQSMSEEERVVESLD